MLNIGNRKIRLSESELRSFIKESVMAVLEDYQITLSNSGNEGFNNMRNVLFATKELSENGFVVIHIPIDMHNVLDVTIRKEDGGYVCYSKNFKKLCATPNDAIRIAMDYARDIKSNSVSE